MGRMSIKPDKNIYHQAREALKLTRAAASELMGFVSESRIEKIEYEKTVPSRSLPPAAAPPVFPGLPSAGWISAYHPETAC